MEEAKEQLFKSWAILELMGHRRLAGLVSEEARFGTTLLRIDVPHDPKDGGKEFVTQYYGGGSIYCLTPTTEETARMVAKGSQPAPVYQYEINRERQLPLNVDDGDQNDYEQDCEEGENDL